MARPAAASWSTGPVRASTCWPARTRRADRPDGTGRQCRWPGVGTIRPATSPPPMARLTRYRSARPARAVRLPGRGDVRCTRPRPSISARPSWILPVLESTEGQSAIDVSTLLKDGGVMTLDYGFANTAATRSAITFIDGDAGILRYRGYPIEQLAERSTFLETAYLLIYGELPTADAARGVDDRDPPPHAPPRGVPALLRRLPARTPIRWASWPRPSRRCRRSTRTRRIPSTRRTSRSARSG